MTTKYLFVILLAICFVSCEKDATSNNNEFDSNADGISNGLSLTDGTSNGEATAPSSNLITENPFIKVEDENISTFSVDADGASYSLTRRFLNEGEFPNPDAIRTEELVNYFNFNYADPEGNHPISLEGEISECPWNQEHQLVRIGIKGKSIDLQQVPASNIVFLIDISGSMRSDDRLPLLQKGLKKYVDQIRDEDFISIVTYAGNAGLALASTSGSEKNKIKNAIDALSSGGSTNGEGGIIQAYIQAEKNMIECGNNRIIVASDGGFNVGVTDQEELINLIEEKRESGIFLTIVGVGSSVNEGLLEQIANNGNGNFEYLDSEAQLDKVFIDEFNKFYTVAKDVKIQVDFNRTLVKEYRLIGYENRLLSTEEFLDDTKDGGEIGAGQSITALYEVIPTQSGDKSRPAFSIDFRYKDPKSDSSEGLTLDIKEINDAFEDSSDNQKFAAAVASFGLLLRDSEYKGETSFKKIKSWANDSKSFDPYGYKNDFMELIDIADGI